MMSRINVTMNDYQRALLGKIASREYRDLRNQASMLFQQAIEAAATDEDRAAVKAEHEHFLHGAHGELA